MTLQRNNAAALLAATVSMALLAASCSSSDDDAGDKTTVTSTGANSSTDVAATDQDGATRTVTDSEGTEVEVPVHPQRAVTLHFAGTEALLDLGVTPVLQGAGDLESMLPPEEFAKVKDVPQVETGNDLNIEKVAQAKPDIILAADMVDKKIVEQLREFAPVYVYTHSKDRSNWQGRGDQIADAMNLNTKLDEVKAELAKRQSTIAYTYRDTLSGIHAALPVSWKADSFTVVGSESMPGRILAPAGLQWDQTTTEMTKGIDGQELTQSTENVASTLKDANVIFYGTDLHGKASAETTAVMDLEAFKDLPAAKDKRVFPIGKQTIAGYLDAFNALNLLENALKELQK